MAHAYKSRFPHLWYGCEAPSQWTIYDNQDQQMASVGPKYKSKDELLADLERFAIERGFADGAATTPQDNNLTEQEGQPGEVQILTHIPQVLHHIKGIGAKFDINDREAPYVFAITKGCIAAADEVTEAIVNMYNYYPILKKQSSIWCNAYKEAKKQRDELLEAIKAAKLDLHEWHNYNVGEVESFTGNDRQCQIDKCRQILVNLEKVQAAIEQATK